MGGNAFPVQYGHAAYGRERYINEGISAFVQRFEYYFSRTNEKC